MAMTVEVTKGLSAHGSVYVSNPVLEDVSEQFDEELRDDLGRTFGDGMLIMREDLVLPMRPFSFDDAVKGFDLVGVLCGHNVHFDISKPQDAGHHDFRYELTVLD